MNSRFEISVVVSSFNRDDKVGETLRTIFESDLSKFESIELIVIDDGSPLQLSKVLDRFELIPAVFKVRLIRQENSGIGATRNRGFREAVYDTIVFLDDDILLHRTTLKDLVEALRGSSVTVVYGSYPFVSHASESLRKFAVHLYGYPQVPISEELEAVNAIASGLLVVDRSALKGVDNLYNDAMTIPAAEEHEIIARFQRLGIPIFYAERVTAIHNHHLELKWLIAQQYKYGLATAEAFAKVPDIAQIEKFAVLKATLEGIGRGSVKNKVKRLVASGIGGKLLLSAAFAMEKALPNGNHNALFGLVATSYFWNGYLKGRRRFLNFSSSVG